MAFVILKSKGNDEDVVNIFLQDDKVSRMTVLKREGSIYGEDGTIYLFEGNDEAVSYVRAKRPASMIELDPEKAEKIYTKIKEENDNAEQGMGFVFG
ncbi:hypothetical protein [Thermoplasma sp.]|uniref:hypothetical protein n=1 Tax=Thermoplasma sp. TaxID=1973142 RepID=UPI00128167A9|nr:hypothetical protein [Thermoplasma sp.]KAA8923036.1 MAG: hypothetical protein F6Q11_02255 [Thermoplasma sp.]